MDIVYIVFAFCCGFGFSLFGLPTLIGFLVAGFALNFAGAATIILLYITAPASEFGVYNSATIAPMNWGVDSSGDPCPFGGCTTSPTRFPTNDGGI